MANARAVSLDLNVDADRDLVLGAADAEITLVEYGSYVCSYCHTAHAVVTRLRDRFGQRMRYVYRHLPLTDRQESTYAAELIEYAAATGQSPWELHNALMEHGATFRQEEIDTIGAGFGVPARADWDPDITRVAKSRVREDARSGIRSGARVTPTFFINGRRYEGAWDEASLSEAMLRSLGHRMHTASLDFARWAPSTGFLLLLMTLIAVVISNTALGPAFLEFWESPAGFRFASREYLLPLMDWVNHGLLSIFFLVVGLEIKRELTVGRLATRRAAAFPIAAAFGGMIVPALIFVLLAPREFSHAWGVTIATDTAFAIALMVLLGERVPVDLRVFLTAAVIVDDLVAIIVVALFYAGAISIGWLLLSALVIASLVAINRAQVYNALVYATLGIVLWFALHEAGLHATLAGVILAVVTPTRPPPDLKALIAQAQAIIDAETRLSGTAVLKTGPSAQAIRALDAVHDRIESPASKMLHAVEPWSSYLVLPIFALANAGVVWSADVLDGHARLIIALAAALVLGKTVGIFAGARMAVQFGIGAKPSTYTWRQVLGAGALGGIGFTMSLFIAGQAFDGADYDAAKIAIFVASIIAGLAGTLILWTARPADVAREHGNDVAETGSPVSVASNASL